MAILSQPDQQMFGKYYGNWNLIQDEKFWDDAFTVYKDRNVPLPLEVTPFNCRMVLELLECKPGECAGCCNYAEVNLVDYDLVRMANHGIEAIEGKVNKAGQKVMDTTGGCKFLKDKACSIYEARPSTCAFFPLQFGMFAEINGEKKEVLQIRIRCTNAMKAVFKVAKQYLEDNKGYILLPNLTLIKTEE